MVVADFVALVVGGWHGCMALVVIVLVVVVMDCVSGRCEESGYDLPPREWVSGGGQHERAGDVDILWYRCCQCH